MQKFGVQDSEINRYFNLVDLLKRSSKLNISANKDQPKKLLILKLIDGPIKKNIVLHPEQMPITFGRQAPKMSKAMNNRFE